TAGRTPTSPTACAPRAGECAGWVAHTPTTSGTRCPRHRWNTSMTSSPTPPDSTPSGVSGPWRAGWRPSPTAAWPPTGTVSGCARRTDAFRRPTRPIPLRSTGMDLHPNIAPYGFLTGTWTGKGHGFYPTIEDFSYDETLIFSTIPGKPFFRYEQKTMGPNGP